MSNAQRLMMERAFDPTSADSAMELAYDAIRLLEDAQKILDTDAAGMRLGRDQRNSLAEHMRIAGRRLGILTENTGAAADDFHDELGKL